MNEKSPTLLPSGFYDLLPPDARKETLAVSTLLAAFDSFGYEQVSPPLMEFEASLLSGRGATLSAQTFRVMDPLSQSMMGIRADMTMQVARIAHARMGNSPRPLRLCYAGPIVQITPEALQSERQLTQAGVELIGSPSPQADAEVMLVAAEALAKLGIEGVSIDINLPGLLARLCPEAQQNTALQTSISHAVAQRDSASIEALPLAQAKVISRLLTTAGNAQKSLAVMEELHLPEIEALAPIVAYLATHCPSTRITIDPLEFRGFAYHQGISFSVFARNLRHELGRGGRYEVDGETATGFTFYVSHLLDLLPSAGQTKRILLAANVPSDVAQRLRKEGWKTLTSLTATPEQEARELGASALWQDGKMISL